jgi:hypothetical protein
MFVLLVVDLGETVSLLTSVMNFLFSLSTS